MIVSAACSPLRVLAWVVAAVPIVLLAIDMTFSYRFYPEPEHNDVVLGQVVNDAGEETDVFERQYTVSGRTERRRDIALGGALLLAGTAVMVWGIKEMVRPRRVLEADANGLRLRVNGPGRRPLNLGWAEIVTVRSSVIVDDDEELPVLSIQVSQPTHLPERPWGARLDSSWIHLLSAEWDIPAHQVAPLLAGMPGSSGGPPVDG